MTLRPEVSIVLATHNRREVVLHTLAQLGSSGMPRDRYEIIVVDNASTDGTPAAVAPHADRVIRLRRNRGSCAKAYAERLASGRFVVFLDDDSYPLPGTLERMIERFESDPALGAAGFTVTLPDGQLEGAALPDVFVGCGVGFRRDALRAAGGLDKSFFMQAEEYDLAFRIAEAGWKVRVFDDLRVQHLKTAQARRSERTTYYDTRNNLRVLARHVPDDYYGIYRADCLQRYAWLAQREGHWKAFRRGLRAGLAWSAIERWTCRTRMAPAVFESFFRIREIERRMIELRRFPVRVLVLADLGKNVFPFWRGATQAGLRIAAIGDDRFAAPGRTYRGVPVIPLDEALSQHCDAVVIANTGPVHAARTHNILRTKTRRPIHDWFGRPCAQDVAGFVSPPPTLASDDIPVAHPASLSLAGRG